MKRLLHIMIAVFLLSISGASASTILPEDFHAGFYAFSGIWGKRAVVLCESLTVCDTPNGTPLDSLLYGESLIATEQCDGWIHGYYSDGNRNGWVRADYLLVNPACHVADSQTPVYAYTDTAAPRVALLSAGTHLPVICDIGAWRIVSLRGAAGCILKSSADSDCVISFPDPLLPDQHELSASMAHELAQAYLLEHHLADAQTLQALPYDFAYYGHAQIGWVVRWRDSSGGIVWQVALEKNTGAILEAVNPSLGIG